MYACVVLHTSSTSTSCFSIILCVTFFLHLSSESIWNKPACLQFSTFAFLTHFYRSIWNEEIVCSQEYLLITRFTDVVTNLLFNHSYIINDGSAMQAWCKWSVENKDMSMNVCNNSAHFSSDNFHVQKCHLKTSFAIFIFHLHEFVNQCQREKIPALFCMKFTPPKK